MQLCISSNKQVEKFSMFWIYIDDEVDLFQDIFFFDMDTVLVSYGFWMLLCALVEMDWFSHIPECLYKHGPMLTMFYCM